MSDDVVRTMLDTDRGRFGLQEYFVAERTEPRVRSITFAGIEHARPSPEAVAAVAAADLVVIGPSNPLISIAPILLLLDKHLVRERTLVVSPVVEGRSLKGPTVEMLVSTGRDPSPEGIARHYRDVAAWFVLDSRDAQLGIAVQSLGYGLVVTDTVMADEAGARRLASTILDAVRVSV
jgi:LPPG:FO 2-phospho-L-lactate transferase